MASDYRSFYVEQTHLLFLLRFRSGQFRQHRIQKLRQKFAVFNLVASHTEATFKQLPIELLQNMVTEFFRTRPDYFRRCRAESILEDGYPLRYSIR